MNFLFESKWIRAEQSPIGLGDMMRWRVGSPLHNVIIRLAKGGGGDFAD